MSEVWVKIKGFENYSVSNLGRVRNDLNERLLKPNPNKVSGHMRVNLGRGNTRLVHKLVCEAFLGSCKDGMEVRHLDDRPDNNLLSNLQYGTRSQNMDDRRINQTQQYSSCYPGISWHKKRGKWYASKYDKQSKKMLHLGSFDTEEEARKKYEDSDL